MAGQIKNKQPTCPQCGAPVNSEVCQISCLRDPTANMIRYGNENGINHIQSIE